MCSLVTLARYALHAQSCFALEDDLDRWQGLGPGVPEGPLLGLIQCGTEGGHVPDKPLKELLVNPAVNVSQ